MLLAVILKGYKRDKQKRYSEEERFVLLNLQFQCGVLYVIGVRLAQSLVLVWCFVCHWSSSALSLVLVWCFVCHWSSSCSIFSFSVVFNDVRVAQSLVYCVVFNDVRIAQSLAYCVVFNDVRFAQSLPCKVNYPTTTTAPPHCWNSSKIQQKNHSWRQNR